LGSGRAASKGERALWALTACERVSKLLPIYHAWEAEFECEATHVRERQTDRDTEREREREREREPRQAFPRDGGYRLRSSPFPTAPQIRKD
jgi:hypothetical protein